jgi:hypothetical protein
VLEGREALVALELQLLLREQLVMYNAQRIEDGYMRMLELRWTWKIDDWMIFKLAPTFYVLLRV